MSAQERIALYALIGDIKETLYSQMLLISALGELLHENQVFDPADLKQKIAELEQQDTSIVASATSRRQDV